MVQLVRCLCEARQSHVSKVLQHVCHRISVRSLPSYFCCHAAMLPRKLEHAAHGASFPILGIWHESIPGRPRPGHGGERCCRSSCTQFLRAWSPEISWEFVSPKTEDPKALVHLKVLADSTNQDKLRSMLKIFGPARNWMAQLDPRTEILPMLTSRSQQPVGTQDSDVQTNVHGSVRQAIQLATGARVQQLLRQPHCQAK